MAIGRQQNANRRMLQGCGFGYGSAGCDCGYDSGCSRAGGVFVDSLHA